MIVQVEPEFDLKTCLTRVRQNDDTAATELMRHLHPLVLKIVRSHLPRRASEEDLAQVIYLRVFTKLDQYKSEAPFEHWVSRIAVNTCLNELKHEKARPELRQADMSEEEVAVIDALAASEGELDSSQAYASREITDMLLERLKPEDRFIVSQMYLEGRSVDELKALTGWGTARIKIRAFRARLKMKADLAKIQKERNS